MSSVSTSSTPDIKVMTDARYIPLVVLGCCSSCLSVVGSSCVIYMSRRKLNKIMHRLVFALSVSDLISSIALLITPFMVPSILGLPGAIGTFDSCAAMGFLVGTFLVTGSFYNLLLSSYYLLTVKSKWKESALHTNHALEGLIHCVILAIPLSINSAAVATQSINPYPLASNVCTYYPWPWTCADNDDIPCTRSSLPTAVTFVAIRVSISFFCTIACLVLTIMVWATVRETLRKSDAYRFRGDNNVNNNNNNNNNNNSQIQQQIQSNKRLRDVSIQAVLYSLVYFNTFFWPFLGLIFSVPRILSTADAQEGKNGAGFYALNILYWTFYPLQGFLNFFVYTRQSVKRWRKAAPERSIYSIYKEILANTKVPPPPRKTPLRPVRSHNPTTDFDEQKDEAVVSHS